jgi:uncharacterized iron-regulated protein
MKILHPGAMIRVFLPMNTQSFANSIVASALSLCALVGCTTVVTHPPWEHQLRGDTIALLGEVHDNAEHHRLRLQVLRRALAAGWRPAIAMEQLDRERQADIERARRERPRDARHVIDLAAPAKGARGNNWNWDFYRPFIELALEYDVPLIAVNLSTADASKVAREGYAAVFDTASMKALRLGAAIAPELQSAQEREIDIGHCNALPPPTLPAMARAQLARDAMMAAILGGHALHGVVLIAGNGHVRRDIGVPHWLSPAQRTRVLTVGYLESDTSPALEVVFDAVVRTAAADRTDPCIAFKKRLKPA